MDERLPTTSSPGVRAFRHISQSTALLAVGLSALALFGWATDSLALTRLWGHWVPLHPMAALALGLAGLALWCGVTTGLEPPVRLAGRVLGAVVAAIGLSRVSDALIGTHLGVDGWLFPGRLEAWAPSHHIATPTAWCLFLLGTALLLLPVAGPRGRRPSEWLALVALLGSYQGILAYLFTAPAPPMAALASVGLTALAIGVLCARPEEGLMRHVASPNTGGRLLRVLLPALALLPLPVALLSRVGQALAFRPAQSELIFTQAMLVAIAVAFAWWVGAALNREDAVRRAYESELVEREDALRQALSRTFDVVAIFVQGRMVFVNDAGLRLLGAHRPDELVGSLLGQHLAPEERALAIRHVGEALEARTVPVIETTLVRLDGRPVQVELTAIAITHQGQSALEVVARDISGRKALERALRESTTRFDALFEGALFGVLMLDAKGRVIEGNHVAQRMFGQTAATWLGLSVTALIHPDDVSQVITPFWEMVTAGAGAFDVDARLVANAGQTVWAHLSGFYVAKQAADAPVVMLMIEDVSDRHDLQESLRAANEALREGDRLRTDLIHAVAHDLRSPLSAMIGYSDLLRDQVAGPLNDNQREFVAIIRRNGQRLNAMVDDMVDFVHVEAGNLELDVAPTNFNRLVEDVVKTFMPVAAMAGLHLEARLPDEPVVGEVDGARLERVLANLVGNAIKFTPSGGTVTISAAAEGQAIRVAVTDTGIGISGADQRRLFQRYSRLESGKRMATGSGLGLYICKSLVEAHHGIIGVESAPQAGSTFWFEVPIQPLRGVPEASHEPGGRAGRSSPPGRAP